MTDTMKRKLEQSFDDVSAKAQRLTPDVERLAPQVSKFCSEFNNNSQTDIDLRRVMDEFVNIYEKLDNRHDITMKPNYSYTELVYLAVLKSPNFCLPIGEIYKYIQWKFEFFKTGTRQHWRNAVRHSLSKTKCFTKISVGRSPNPAGVYQRSTFLWSVVPSSIVNFARGDYRPNVDRESGTNTLRWGFYRVNAGLFWDEVAIALEEKMTSFREAVKLVSSPSDIFQRQVCLLSSNNGDVSQTTSTQNFPESKHQQTPEQQRVHMTSQHPMTSPSSFPWQQTITPQQRVTSPFEQISPMQYHPISHQQQFQHSTSPMQDTTRSQPHMTSSQFAPPTVTPPMNLTAMIPPQLLPPPHFFSYSPIMSVNSGSHVILSPQETCAESPVEPDVKLAPSLQHQMTLHNWSPEFLSREGAMSAFNLTNGSDSDTSIRSENQSCHELSPMTSSSELSFWIPPPKLLSAPPNVTMAYKEEPLSTSCSRLATSKLNTSYLPPSSPLTDNNFLNSTTELPPFTEMPSLTSLLAFDNNVDHSVLYSHNGTGYYDISYITPQSSQPLGECDYSCSYNFEKQDGGCMESGRLVYADSASHCDSSQTHRWDVNSQ